MCQPNPLLTGSLDLALGHAKDRRADLGRQIRLGDLVEVVAPHALIGELLRHVRKGRARRELLLGFLDGGLIGGEELLDRAPLGCAELLDPVLVFGLDLVLGNLDLVEQILGLQRDEGQAPILGRRELLLVRVVESREIVCARLGHIGDRIRPNGDVVAAPLLVPVTIKSIDQNGGHHDRSGEAPGQGAPHDLLSQQGEIAVLGQSVGLQQLLEAPAIEPSGRLERRIVGDQLPEGIVGHGQAHVVGAQIDQAARDQPLQRLLHETELDRLLAIDGGADLALQIVERPVEGVGQLARRNCRAADRCHGRIARVAEEHIADAPDRKAHHQEQHQDFDDPGPGLLAQHIEHGRDT